LKRELNLFSMKLGVKIKMVEINLEEIARLPEFQGDNISRIVREKISTQYGKDYVQGLPAAVSAVERQLRLYYAGNEHDSQVAGEVSDRVFNEMPKNAPYLRGIAKDIWASRAARYLLKKEGIETPEEMTSMSTNNFSHNFIKAWTEQRFEEYVQMAKDGEEACRRAGILIGRLNGYYEQLGNGRFDIDEYETHMGSITWGDHKKELLGSMLERARLEVPVIKELIKIGYSWEKINR